MKSKMKLRTITRSKTRKKMGGKVIASGGYGCIFNPALKCKTQKNSLRGQITKLMKTKYAQKEYDDVIRFRTILSDIPNYENYFLVDDFTLCEPKPLSQDDLKKYDKKCKALKKIDITSNNINQSLGKILALNMPNGGINVGNFIDKQSGSQSIINLNNSLIDLLLKGIVPMNGLHIYHCDVKASNVLVDNKNSNSNSNSNNNSNNLLITRLIDWGLSTTYNNESFIPKILCRRPFQYNVPFSIVLFNKVFIDEYNNFLTKNGTKPTVPQIREFVVHHISRWINIRGSGHLKTMKKQTDKLGLPKNNYIIEYLTKILDTYTYSNKFHLYEYFTKVFIKNIDIWGFTMIYMPLVDKKGLQKHLTSIFSRFLFENPTEQIDFQKLSYELKKINQLL